eukprot:6471979-Pyramimonas_sp.AAC.1
MPRCTVVNYFVWTHSLNRRSLASPAHSGCITPVRLGLSIKGTCPQVGSSFLRANRQPPNPACLPSSDFTPRTHGWPLKKTGNLSQGGAGAGSDEGVLLGSGGARVLELALDHLSEPV